MAPLTGSTPAMFGPLAELQKMQASARLPGRSRRDADER